MQLNAKEAIGFPGFYEIPEFNRYCVSKDGRVLNKLKTKLLKGSKNPAGYHNFRMRSDFGGFYTYGRHRLLGDVFIPKFNGTVVNHKNGVKGDDRLDNLEWTTIQGNIEHAGLMGISEKCKPVSIRNVKTGEVLHFPSIVKCARFLNFTKDAVNYRVKIGESRVFPEEYQYRFFNDKKDWEIPNFIENKLYENSTSKGIFTRNLQTSEIKFYKRIKDLAKELNVHITTISIWMKENNQPVIPGLLQLKWARDPNGWRIVTDWYYELSRFNKTKPIQITNTKTKEVQMYLSRAECCLKTGIHFSTLTYRLQTNGRKVFSNNCIYQYYQEKQSYSLEIENQYSL